ncbi:MAG: ATP12 family protein [Henriciella sp.]|nr:ATP12 family protein [Henriciella sp.]
MTPTDAPKRFYKSVAVAPAGDAFTIELDGRPVKTPARAPLQLPTTDLAAALAGEWDSQGETLDMASMTLTKLANVAIDRTPGNRTGMADELAKYAETDVVCYFAEGPTPLRERQQAAWTPWRDWAGKTLNVVLLPVEGIVAAPQPPASLEAVRQHALALDAFSLTGLSWGCGLFGSAVLALAVEQGALPAAEALSLSCVDEDWQIEQWGEDADAAAARAVREAECAALQTWFDALS